MAGLDDITKGAADFLNSDGVKDALKSEQAEDISDNVLDSVEGFVGKVTGAKFDAQTDALRDQADKLIGNE